MPDITLTAADGHQLAAYIAGPADAKRALVVVQEIFGVNHHMRHVALVLALFVLMGGLFLVADTFVFTTPILAESTVSSPF